MTKIKPSELTGAALDWAVAQCTGDKVRFSEPHEQLLVEGYPYMVWSPQKNWAQGGPVIERENIQLTTIFVGDLKGNHKWGAYMDDGEDFIRSMQGGPTPLIAAMRCFVASELGAEVDVPEELL